jgi:hypothetical protein
MYSGVYKRKGNQLYLIKRQVVQCSPICRMNNYLDHLIDDNHYTTTKVSLSLILFLVVNIVVMIIYLTS